MHVISEKEHTYPPNLSVSPQVLGHKKMAAAAQPFIQQVMGWN